MIWFACKQCGKRHGRVENLAGTLVFCECGHGNRVPWESTVAEPEETPVPAPAARPRPSPDADDDRRPAETPLPRRRVREARRPNPAYCLNHEDRDSEKTCDACHARFCAACVVTLEGRTLCGPCKNFRIRGLRRPARTPPLALVALVVSLISGPVSLFIVLMALGLMTNPDGSVPAAIALCLIAAALPVSGLVLGRLALRDIETKPNLGGRSLAVTGMTTGAAGVLLGAAMTLVLICKQWQG